MPLAARLPRLLPGHQIEALQDYLGKLLRDVSGRTRDVTQSSQPSRLDGC
jgi:hypothetical protein